MKRRPLRTKKWLPFWRAFGTSWLLLSLLAGIWTLATPIGAAPDEPAHLIKAASVARGQFIGDRGPQGEVVQVPQYIAFTHAQTCFAFEENVSASCMAEVPGNAAELVDAPTTAGLYNPAYYLIVGWPSLLAQDSSGVYLMRIVSGIAVSLLLAVAFALIATWRRPTIPMIGFATALTPMVIFLNGTVNPNTMEIAATLAAFVGLLTVIREPDTGRLVGIAAIVIAAAALAANMRGLSLLWLAVALLSPFLLVSKDRLVGLLKTRPVQIAIGAVAIAAVLALIWLLNTNSLGAALDDPGPVTNAPGVGTSAFLGFVWTLLSTFHYAQGIVGVFGWLDTPAPPEVFFVWAVLAGGLALLALVLLRGRALLLALALIVAVLLLPPILQGIYITDGGIIWQGRYILPIFVCAMVAITASLSDQLTLSKSNQTRLLVLVISAWAIAQFASFATALRRYAVGLDEGWQQLLSPEWVPPGGVLPLLTGFAIVLVAASISLLIFLRRHHEPLSSHAQRSSVRQ